MAAMLKLTLAAILFPLVLVGCAADEEATTSGSVCPPGSTLTYESFGRTFMTSYCTSCHAAGLVGAARQGAPSDHNLDALESIRDTGAEHLDAEAAAGTLRVNQAMPPVGSPAPTESERLALGEWLACGMP